MLEFEEFMKIEGCKRKHKHLFVGSRKQPALEESISEVRYVDRMTLGLFEDNAGVIGWLTKFFADMIFIRPPRV